MPMILLKPNFLKLKIDFFQNEINQLRCLNGLMC